MSFEHDEKRLLTLHAVRAVRCGAYCHSVCGVSINQDKCWLTVNRDKVLWLPVQFRPSCWTVSETTIAIECHSGNGDRNQVVASRGLKRANSACADATRSWPERRPTEHKKSRSKTVITGRSFNRAQDVASPSQQEKIKSAVNREQEVVNPGH